MLAEGGLHLPDIFTQVFYHFPTFRSRSLSSLNIPQKSFSFDTASGSIAAKIPRPAICWMRGMSNPGKISKNQINSPSYNLIVELSQEFARALCTHMTPCLQTSSG